VLFLDELPEFDRRVLEGLREPLETGTVCIARAGLQANYPAQFQLVAAMNPCPSGCRTERGAQCECTPPQLQRYHSRLSGPLLDRIDMLIPLERVEAHQWIAHASVAEESSAALAVQVSAARERQVARQGCLNSRLRADNTLAQCRLEREALRTLEASCERYRLSARSGHRLARVARSIADLQGAPTVGAEAISEAVALRLA
jgi:magnesium chelatase family protein